MIVGDKVVFEKIQNDSNKINLLLDLDSTIIYSKKYKKIDKDKITYEDDICSTVICEFENENNIYHIHMSGSQIK